MTTKETRKYEMLVRVATFGETYRDVFPPDSVGGQAFTVVRKAVQQLGEHTASTLARAREGKRAKDLARGPLIEQLEAVRLSARTIAGDVPGFDLPFQIAHPRTDQRVLAAARVFVREAEQAKSSFLAYGMDDMFIDRLKEALAAFERAVSTVHAGLDDHAAARADIEEALSSGTAAVHKLEVIVANRLRTNPKALGAWDRERLIEGPRRAKKGTTLPADAPEVAAPATTEVTGAAPSAAPDGELKAS